MGSKTKNQRRWRCILAIFLLVTFSRLLAQPQIGSLSHTHAGDDHPHSHREHSFPSPAFHTHGHSHGHHSHTPAGTQKQAHAGYTPHRHHHRHVHHTRKARQKPQGPLWREASSSRVHWHVTIPVHLSGVLISSKWTLSLTYFVLRALNPLQFHWTFASTYRSRAPPLFW